VAEQAHDLTHVHQGFNSLPRLYLARELARLTPDGLNRVSFTVGGGLAIEAAMKISLKSRPGSRQFMRSSARKPRRLRRGGRAARRRRAKRLADSGSKRRAAREVGRASGSCYNRYRESTARRSHGISAGVSLCLDSTLPPQSAGGGCSSAAGGVDPRDLRCAGLGDRGVDGATRPCASVCRLSAP